MTRDFCVVLVHSIRFWQWQKWNWGLFCQQQLQIAWLRWSWGDWWHETCPQLHTRKRQFTACWFQLHHVGAQYSVLSLVTTSCVEIGYFANTSVKNQRTSELSLAESKCADTDTYDSGILHRSLRSVEPVCFPASHKALSQIEPRGSLAATVLTNGKTLPEGSADLEIYIRRIREAFCLPRWVICQ